VDSRTAFAHQLRGIFEDYWHSLIEHANTEKARLIKFVNSHDIRKSIARTLTIINTTQRQQLRLFYKTKKYAPLDLRPKQTRAIRRRLSPTEAKIVTEKTKKKVMHFPQRRFAVKAA